MYSSGTCRTLCLIARHNGLASAVPDHGPQVYCVLDGEVLGHRLGLRSYVQHIGHQQIPRLPRPQFLGFFVAQGARFRNLEAYTPLHNASLNNP